jgi:hypothetical protein
VYGVVTHLSLGNNDCRNCRINLVAKESVSFECKSLVLWCYPCSEVPTAQKWNHSFRICINCAREPIVIISCLAIPLFHTHSLCIVLLLQTAIMEFVQISWYCIEWNLDLQTLPFCKAYLFIFFWNRLLLSNKNADSSLIEISGSHGGEYEDGCLLGCCAV